MARVRPITSWDEVPIVMNLDMAARILDVSYEALKKRCQLGKFPGFKAGELWRVEKETFRDYIKSQQSRE